MRGKTTHQGIGCLALIGPAGAAVNQAWRTLSGSLCWLTFGLGCLLLAAAAPLVRLSSLQGDKQTRRLRLCAHHLSRLWMQFCRLVGSIDVCVVQSHPPGNGLLVANHPSLLDAIWVIGQHRNLCCIIKGDLQRISVFRYLIRQLGYVSNQDPELLLQESCNRLRQGETLLVFPEATRTPVGELPRFFPGSAELAVRTGVTVQPIVIHKPGAYLSKGYPWYQFPDATLRPLLEFCAPLPLPSGTSRRQARRALTAELQRFFHHRLDTQRLHIGAARLKIKP